MSEFDDPLLRQALQRLAGYPPEEDAAYTEVRFRSRVIRQRRAAIGAMVCATVFGLGLYALNTRPGSEVKTGSAAAASSTSSAASTIAPDSSVAVPSTNAQDSNATVASPLDPNVTTTEGALGAAVSAGPELASIPPTVAPEPVETALGSQQSPSGNGSSSGAPSSGGSPTAATRPPTATHPPVTTRPPAATRPPVPTTTRPPTPTPPTDPTPTDPPTNEPSTLSQDTTGGLVTVSSDGSTLSLVAADAHSGFTVDIHRRSGRSVSVTFTDPSTTWSVKARLDSGRIVFEVHQDDHPQTTSNEQTSSSGLLDGGGRSDGKGGDPGTSRDAEKAP